MVASEKPKNPAGYELYMMRHGAAVERGSAGHSDDSKRPLTPEGQKKLREISGGLNRLGFDPDWIVSSPLIRAVETAKLVAESLGSNVPVDFADALLPGGSPEALIAFLAKRPTRARVLVVGHEPDLSEMAGRLIGAGRRSRLAFKKGGCCLIIFDQFPPKSPGTLVWWLTPRILRKLA
jgi:phosphohistidine phosphatase